MRWKKNENKNVLQQNFTVKQPNEVWVSDVTYFNHNGLVYYLCVIMDLFSRKIIAHKISKKHSTQLITKTFKAAYQLRTPQPGLIFHSDRGAPYTSYAFRELLYKNQIKQSLSRSGKPHDNAVSESFFSSLKREELYRRKYRSERELYRYIDEYIDFYNKKGRMLIYATVHLKSLRKKQA